MPIRRITSFSTLAQAYFPGCATAKNAVRCLNRWISRCGELKEKLLTTGYKPYNHRSITPKQFNLIIDYLGDPEEE